MAVLNVHLKYCIRNFPESITGSQSKDPFTTKIITFSLLQAAYSNVSATLNAVAV